MFQWIATFLSSSGFMPHVHCYLARPALVWTMFSTDLLIGFSYLGISLTLLTLLKTTKISFSLMVVCFGVFIGACGLTHFMEVWTLWYPHYYVSAAVKAVTAAASVGTAVYLFRSRHLIVRVAQAAKEAEQRRLDLEAVTVKLEKTVAERSSELDTFFEVAPIGLVQVDAASRRLLQVNPALCEIFGYSEEELLGMTIDDLTIPNEQTGDRVRFRELVAGETSDASYEKRYLRKDGSAIWGSVKLRLLRDENGHVHRAVAAIQDISARKATELALIERQERLERSELRYRTLTEALPQLVWTCLPNGQCDYLSQQWVDYTGMEMTEQLGYDWLDKVIHPEDRERTFAHWRGAVEGLHPYDIEYRIRRHDGAYRWFQTRGTPARNAHGEIIYWSGTCTDVEAQKSTQLALEQSRSHFESIANNIPQLAWMTESDGAIFWYNQNWYDYTGTTLAQMQGWGWKAVHHPDFAERVSVKWLEHLRSGEPWEDVFPLRGRNGEWRWFLSRARPTRDASGKIAHWLGTNTDITEQRQAREDLLRANKAKDDLLLICSHELRTPVAAMNLAGQVALRGLEKSAPPELTLARLKKMAEQNDGQLRRLNILIDEMLEFSQISSGHLRLHPERFDLRDLLSETVRYLGADFGKQKCVLEADPGTEPAVGQWDRIRLRHVIINLLTNALKYGEGKPVAVKLQVSGGEARLNFQDQGIGIAPADQGRIFLPYERAVSHYNISGLGLGLYIAAEILKAHGGRISLRSEEGRGSTFTVHLPLA